jgi:hypothetical protein
MANNQTYCSAIGCNNCHPERSEGQTYRSALASNIFNCKTALSS